MLLDPATPPTVEQIYEVLESDGPPESLSDRMQGVIKECHTRWPGEDPAGNVIESPWASWPLARDLEPPVIEVHIRWDYATTMLPALIEVAARHEVVLFDPQAGAVHLPPRLT